ncbi:hypothetical protein ACWU37_21880 (plasmid) [Photobacterium damselae subsp. damselae]
MTYSVDEHSTITKQPEATQGVALSTQGSLKNEDNKSLNREFKRKICKQAWKLAAIKAMRFGGDRCIYFAACLKVVYSQIRLTHSQSYEQYGELMKLNNQYLKRLKEQLSHNESKPNLMHREQNIVDLTHRIKTAQIRQSYYIDLIFFTGIKL